MARRLWTARRFWTTCFAAGLWSCLMFGTGYAEPRVALVIGNSAYRTVPELTNPANDAVAMSELLGNAGFEVVTASDLTQSDMRRAIGDFADRIAGKGPDTVALVYYAGHGVQVDGENFLIPVDARIGREADVPMQAVRLADVMNALASVPSRTRIVILDACRNNPFSEINKVTGRGLAIMDAPSGSIVSYSTAPGSEAEDGAGRNSPYTAALLATAREPGLPIEQALKRVRFAVHQSTSGRQTPWESSSLTSDFTFFGGEPTGTPSAAATAGGTAPVKVAARTGGRSVAAWEADLKGKSQPEAYRLVVEEDEIEAYQAYLSLFPTAGGVERVREIVERRRVMVAWYKAVTINMPASYQTFIAAFPGSDFIATADRLLGRASTRSLVPDPPVQVAAACTCPPTVVPAVAPSRTEPTRKGRRAAVRDASPVVARQVEEPPPPRRVRQPPIREAGPPPIVVMPPPIRVVPLPIPTGPIVRPPRPYPPKPTGPIGRPYPTGPVGGPITRPSGGMPQGGPIMRGNVFRPMPSGFGPR